MIRFQAPQIEVWEANATLRALICEALDEAGFEVYSTSGTGDEPRVTTPPADLLLLDVEGSDEDFDARLQVYQDAGRAVLFCGLRNSREHFPDTNWLERPFSLTTLLGQCRELLGLGQLPRAANAEADRTLPEDSLSETKRLTIKDTAVLEAALGLQEGKLIGALNRSDLRDDTDLLGPDMDEELAVLELNGDDILVVDDAELSLSLSGDSVLGRAVSAGGDLVGVVQRSTLDEKE